MRQVNVNAAKGANNKDYNYYTDGLFFAPFTAFAGTGVQLIDPEINHNGLILVNCNIYISSAGPFGIAGTCLTAANHQPVRPQDGDTIATPHILSFDNVGTAYGFIDSSEQVFIPANKGLFLLSTTANSSAAGCVLIRKL